MSSLATFATRTDTPAFTFDVQSGQYRDTQGRLVAWSEVRKAVEAIIAGAKDEAATLAERLRKEHRTDPGGAVKRYGEAMLLLITALHRATAFAAASGVSELLVATEADLEATMRKEGRYLAGFVAMLYGLTLITRQASANTGATLRSTMDADSIARRGAAYMDNALITYERQRYMLHVFLDYTEGRRVMNPDAEHCRGCEEQAAHDWTPIGEVKPLGFEECGQWCKCDLEYRKTRVYGA